MIILEIVILAVVQGIGEFLPISSSGHLVVVASLFDQLGYPMGSGQLTLNILLHLGTLAAILVFYRRRIWHLFSSDRRVIGLLAAGSVPAALVGVVTKLCFDDVLVNPMLAGLMFPVTGAMLLWADRLTPQRMTCRELTVGRALWIGAFQAFAILPGISRSGATIVAGLGCGLSREEAATFSFLLAIPVIGGAGLLELIDLARQGAEGTALGPLLLGTALSFVVGLASLSWLIQWLKRGRLHWFAWWVLLLGPVVIVWQLVAR